MVTERTSRIIPHKFLDHSIGRSTETLIIGTFNPALDNDQNPATFFYSRPRNFLWKLLPSAYGEADLRGSSVDGKITFIRQKKIDFIDLVAQIDAATDKISYGDEFVEKHFTQWRDLDHEIDRLTNLRRVGFTRCTFLARSQNQEASGQASCFPSILWNPILTDDYASSLL
jgi:hypothetical protein